MSLLIFKSEKHKNTAVFSAVFFNKTAPSDEGAGFLQGKKTEGEIICDF